MRLLMINLLASALVLFSASFASAYELRLIASTPTENLPAGASTLVSYDLFLDTQGESNIIAISVSLQWDPTIVTYRSDLSAAEDYYPLYAPSGKTGSYLVPINNPPAVWPGNQPPNGDQALTVDFVANGVPPIPTLGISANEYLATLVFETTGTAGASNMLFGFDVFPGTDTGAGFNIGDGAGGSVDVGDAVSIVNTGPVVSVVPEPTTALLVGLGLIGLGVAGRRRA